MIVIIDLEDSTVSLDEPDVLDGFSVRLAERVTEASEGSAVAAIGGLLDDLDAGGPADEPGHVWVSVATIRLLAADQVDDDWSEKFEGVLAYAKTKGWLDGDGTHLKAHLA